jgi:hypothetical protein
MACDSHKNAPVRRLSIRLWVTAGLSVLFSALAAAIILLLHLHGFPAYPVATLPALPIVGALAATGAYLNEEKDEFLRLMFAQCLLGGIGATLAVTTIWGNVEAFARAPHVSLLWVYPVFWIFVSLSYPLVRMRYR